MPFGGSLLPWALGGGAVLVVIVLGVFALHAYGNAKKRLGRAEVVAKIATADRAARERTAELMAKPLPTDDEIDAWLGGDKKS